jgi:hypothetical protein
MKWYGYNRGQTQDEDWGCLYRSVQNACCALGLKVPSVRRLLAEAGRQEGEWGEPGMFVDFFRRKRGWNLTVEAFVLHSTSCIHLTHRNQYVHLRHLPRGFWRDTRAAYVVDDGISAYAVVPWRGKLWWIDPHVVYPETPVPERFRYSTHMRHNKQREGWMILKVKVKVSHA